MVSDYLTDQRERPLTSIYTVDTADARRLIAGQNTTSGLIDLSKIEITKRMKMQINDFYATQLTPSYSDYYQSLKAQQRVAFMKYLSLMIQRAKKFNSLNFRQSLSKYGLSEGEKIHLNILDKLFEARLNNLNTGKDTLKKLISGAI